jgi:cell wall-associated NlpC family hydrolase
VPLSRFWRCAVAVVTGSTLGAGLIALPAGADPGRAKPPPAVIGAPGPAANRPPAKAALDKQINDASDQLEVIVEQYNAVRISLERTKATEAKVAKQLGPLRTAVAKQRSRVGRIAAGVYETSAFSTFSALLSSDSATYTLNQLSTLNELAHARQDQINTLYAAAKVYTDQQGKLARLDSQQSNSYATLKVKRATIINQIAKLKGLRLAAYGTVGLPSTPPMSDYIPPYTPGIGGRVVTFAVAQLGKMYQWAAAGPDRFDCSGLTLAAWKSVGVSLPHNAAMQYRAVAHIKRADLRPGDLVFYFNPVHHVAMYVGENKVIQAPEYGKPVSYADIGLASIHGYGRPG